MEKARPTRGHDHTGTRSDEHGAACCYQDHRRYGQGGHDSDDVHAAKKEKSDGITPWTSTFDSGFHEAVDLLTNVEQMWPTQQG